MKEPIDTLDQQEEFDQMGEAHAGSSELTPIRSDAFELSDDEKIKQIEHHFAKIMDILGLDLTDDSLKGTPRRVAKMIIIRQTHLDIRNACIELICIRRYGYSTSKE